MECGLRKEADYSAISEEEFASCLNGPPTPCLDQFRSPHTRRPLSGLKPDEGSPQREGCFLVDRLLLKPAHDAHVARSDPPVSAPDFPVSCLDSNGQDEGKDDESPRSCDATLPRGAKICSR